MAFFKSGSLTSEIYLEWFDIIRGRATDSGIWKFVDPLSTSVHEEPKKPAFTDYKSTASKFADLDDDEKAIFKEDSAQYRVDIQNFKQECRTIGELREKIIESIHPNHRKLIFGFMTCRDVLIQIKNRLEPAEDIQIMQIAEDYAKARVTPVSKNIESWLMEWERLDIMVKRHKIAEFSDFKFIQDFLSSSSSLLPMWVTSKRMEILKSNKDRLVFLDVLSEFRQFWSLTEFEAKVKITAFPTNFQGLEQPSALQQTNNSNIRNESKPRDTPNETRNCQCGKNHSGQQCYYLAEGKAPDDFQKDDKIVKKFKNACYRPSFRTFIRKSEWTSKWLKDFVNEKWPEGGKNKTSDNQRSENSQGIFITALSIDSNHPLRNEILLDNGADGHVCNNVSFASSELKPPEIPTFVQSGVGKCKIMGYGNMTFFANLGNGKTFKMTVTNVAFAPEFLTSVVSWKLLKRKGVKWNSDTNEMRYKGKLICQLLDRHNHDVFTLKPIPEETRNNRAIQAPTAADNHTGHFQDTSPNDITNIINENKVCRSINMISSRSSRTSSGSEKLWHLRLGHPGPESLKHIKSESVIVDKNGPKTNECDVCALNKTTQRISRRPADKSIYPFERIHFDLVTYSPIGFDGSRYMLHFRDDMTKMNYLYLLINKSGPVLLRHFRNFVSYVKRQFNRDIKIFRCDQEAGLGNQFSEWVNELGILVEWSAVGTSEQNGQSERSGGMIQTKARCLGNGANLPAEYWPEFVMTAAYLINRTPTITNGWLSPLSMLRKSLKIPDRDEFSHLKAFGCTAYALDKSVSKGEKMKPRAKSGFLVGYNSRNIYRILLLDEELVIGTRDVMFDETLFFDKNKTDIPCEESISLVDFSMIPSIPDYVLDIQDPPIRNNEPNSQISDENSTLESKKEMIEAGWIPDSPSNDKIVTDIHVQSEFGLPTPDDSFQETLEPQEIEQPAHLSSSTRPVYSQLDERNILTGPRYREKSWKAKYFNANAFITEFNVFVIGKAKPLKKLSKFELPPPPGNWRELKGHPYAREFREAMNIEYDALLAKNVFQQVKHTDSMHPIPLRWVFTYKFDESGYLLKFKARICVRGDLQPKNDEENYAATLAFQVFRLLTAIICYFDLDTIQVDAVNAFCNSPLDEEIYLYNPPGFSRSGHVLRLLRGLYGLRKSPKLWLKLLSGTLLNSGLHQVPGQPCIFTDFKGIIVFFYVDDIVIAFPAARRDQALFLLRNLTREYEFRVLGDLEWFLGVMVGRDRKSKKLWLSQEAYIDKICHEFDCSDPGRQVYTPMINDRLPKFDKQATYDEIKLYQRKVGSLIYASGVTRPDISRTVSCLAEYMVNPGPNHQEAADRCLFYLYHTKGLCIEYSGSNNTTQNLHCSADAAFGNTEDRRSIQGFVFKLFGGPIHWNSCKQTTVTTSSTEAELLALSYAAKELLWMQRIFSGIKLDTNQTVEIFNDNLQTLRLLNKEDPIIQTKLRHVDIYQHWLRERVQSGHIKVSWISTNKMIADGMTKALTRQNHKNFVQLLNLVYKI